MLHYRDPAQREELINRLEAEHMALKMRVHELEQHIALSPQEQLEVTRLKKLKLRAKDQLYQLQRGSLQSAHERTQRT